MSPIQKDSLDVTNTITETELIGPSTKLHLPSINIIGAHPTANLHQQKKSLKLNSLLPHRSINTFHARNPSTFSRRTPLLVTRSDNSHEKQKKTVTCFPQPCRATMCSRVHTPLRDDTQCNAPQMKFHISPLIRLLARAQLVKINCHPCCFRLTWVPWRGNIRIGTSHSHQLYEGGFLKGKSPVVNSKLTLGGVERCWRGPTERSDRRLRSLLGFGIVGTSSRLVSFQAVEFVDALSTNSTVARGWDRFDVLDVLNCSWDLYQASGVLVDQFDQVCFDIDQVQSYNPGIINTLEPTFEQHFLVCFRICDMVILGAEPAARIIHRTG